MSDSFYRPTHTFSDTGKGQVFNATQVRLYGIYKFVDVPANGTADLTQFVVGLRKGKDAAAADVRLNAFAVDVKDAGSLGLIAAPTQSKNGGTSKKLSAGVIYGYAYEGHCYDLPKPKIMLIPADPEEPKCDDCGYDCKKDCDYRVWVVDKLDQCVEIEVNQGFVEQLVLEANMPGKRSPSTYRATMAMAHRSGRLTE
jgi:hypothetical protein